MKALKQRRGFTLIELMIVVAIIGILAAVAIPNFVRFQARSKQGEAKTNLKSLFTAQKALFAEKDRYDNNGAVLGFAPEQANRYVYDLGSTLTMGGLPAGTIWPRPGPAPAGGYSMIGVDPARFGAPAAAPLAFMMTGVGVGGAACPNCSFVGSASGNADNDVTQDDWYISNIDGIHAPTPCTGPNIAPDNTVSAGVPFNANNDVSCD